MLLFKKHIYTPLFSDYLSENVQKTSTQLQSKDVFLKNPAVCLCCNSLFSGSNTEFELNED